MTDTFRPQAPAKAPWALDIDSRRGFRQTVNNNQPGMALWYAVELFAEHDATIAELQAQITELRGHQCACKAEKPAAARAAKKTDAKETDEAPAAE